MGSAVHFIWAPCTRPEPFLEGICETALPEHKLGIQQVQMQRSDEGKRHSKRQELSHLHLYLMAQNCTYMHEELERPPQKYIYMGPISLQDTQVHLEEQQKQLQRLQEL